MKQHTCNPGNRNHERSLLKNSSSLLYRPYLDISIQPCLKRAILSVMFLYSLLSELALAAVTYHCVAIQNVKMRVLVYRMDSYVGEKTVGTITYTGAIYNIFRQFASDGVPLRFLASLSNFRALFCLLLHAGGHFTKKMKWNCIFASFDICKIIV